MPSTPVLVGAGILIVIIIIVVAFLVLRNSKPATVKNDTPLPAPAPRAEPAPVLPESKWKVGDLLLIGYAQDYGFPSDGHQGGNGLMFWSNPANRPFGFNVMSKSEDNVYKLSQSPSLPYIYSGVTDECPGNCIKVDTNMAALGGMQFIPAGGNNYKLYSPALDRWAKFHKIASGANANKYTLSFSAREQDSQVISVVKSTI